MKADPIDEKGIFNTARKIPDEEARDKFVELACSNDQSAMQRVKELLKALQQDDEFLEHPPIDVNATENLAGVAEQPGDTIGNYKLLQQIGEGGFGVVYMAEQMQPIRRKVALKIIKPGMDTKEVIARFEAERQALAQMDHPNIARVLDGGATDSGRPFFVMELVKGLTMMSYCDKNHLSTSDRLKMFSHVCQAVQHAHHKGIIHRDLKPSNVMVTLHDGRPVPKVIDFGVSKALNQQLTEKTLFTAYGQMIGTPAYMSPEQAEMSGLDVDTRSDVYSLGVLLYELLTGKTPFETERLRTAGYAEMLRILQEEEPVPPSTRLTTVSQESQTVAGNRGTDPIRLTQLVRGELDWITLKALEKDRRRRYDSAASLAEDIQRYLDNEAVEACPPTFQYRFKKYISRNRSALIVTAAMVFLLLGGIAATIWQAIRATDEKNRAIAAEELAEQRLAESEAALKEAEAISQFLNDLLKSPRPKTSGGGQNVRLADLLDEAARRLNDAKGISPNRVAELQADLASTYFILGLYEKSIELREKVFQHYSDDLGPNDRQTILAKMQLAVSFDKIGRHQVATLMHEDILQKSQSVVANDDPLPIQARRHWADSLEKVGNKQRAKQLRQESLQISQRVLGEHEETFRAMNGLTKSLIDDSRYEEALQLQKSAVQLCSRLFPAEHPEIYRSKQRLAITYELAGQTEIANSIRDQILKSLQNQSSDQADNLHILLADFAEPENNDSWIIANDSVMGGRSKGGPTFQEGRMTFRGETVTEGRGGFCSTRVRERDPLDLSSANSIQLRVKGDGRTYKFEIRTKASVTPWNAIPYRADFSTKAGEWIEVSIPLDKFVPTQNGLDISWFAPPLDKADVRSFGLMIYDKQPGDFQLQVDWIRASVRKQETDATPFTSTQTAQ